MNIVSVCIHYPKPTSPTQGVFVQRRLEGMANFARIRVVSPQPWFPFVRPYVERDFEASQPLPAFRPKMFYLPGVAKGLDGSWLARVLTPTLRRLHAVEPIDLVDAHFEYPEAVGAVFAAHKLGLPVFVTLRGLLPKYLETATRRRSILSALKGATGIVAVSDSLKQLAIQYGVAPAKIEVIPNAVNHDLFFPADRTPNRASGRTRNIISVGHVVPGKRVHDLIAAFAQLYRADPTLRLAIIGKTTCDSQYAAMIRRQITELKLDSACLLLGECPPDVVANRLRESDVFCLATQNEGCCNSVLEAIACGLPVVTTPVGDNARYVTPGKTGELVEVGNIPQLASAIRHALDTDWDRAQIAATLASRTWSDVGRDVVSHFRATLASTRLSAGQSVTAPTT